MLHVAERPLFTRVYGTLEEFAPEGGSIYLYAETTEERSVHGDEWEARCEGVRFISIIEANPGAVSFRLTDGATSEFSLRAPRGLRDFFDGFEEGIVYLDITGLSHHVWAPLLRAILSAGRRLDCVYVEPESYTRTSVPTDSDIFDLSERIDGISPIPGFASLSSATESAVLVTLLGFEGARFQYVIEQVEPRPGKVIPIIGAPGFRLEYPQTTFLANRASLLETRAWENVKFSRANCPFSVFWTLEDVAARWPSASIQIAPIGTKPHALGAVLFYLCSRRIVELIYDHPIRRPNRTSGKSRVLVYGVSGLQYDSAKLSLD